MWAPRLGQQAEIRKCRRCLHSILGQGYELCTGDSGVAEFPGTPCPGYAREVSPHCLAEAVQGEGLGQPQEAEAGKNMALSWRVLMRRAGQRAKGSGGGHGDRVCRREGGALGFPGPFSFTDHPGAQSTRPAQRSPTPLSGSPPPPLQLLRSEEQNKPGVTRKWSN